MQASKHLVVLTGACISFGAASLQASSIDVICHTETLAFTHTNFTKDLNVPQFDPALGTLDLVTLQIALGQESTVKAELLHPDQPGLYEYQLTWDVAMTGLGGQSLLQLVNGAGTSGELTAFDGVLDYDGTSGFTDFYSDDDNDFRYFTSGMPEFISFIGAGSIPFTVDGQALLTMSGTGAPFDVVHETGATARVEVCYEFIPIPEPVSVAFLGAGALLAFKRRRF